ncbi:hypothetical protein FQN57_005947 [Myotisia sp. PD_48]|nr:hypothetical protein FQN57_005947 [Myotisia sp. PD_48]
MPSSATTDPPPFFLTETDHAVLGQTDEEFVYHDWEELKDIIAQNKLELLKRTPSDLRRYLAWTTGIKEKYGSIMNYICQERLRWPITADPQTLAVNPIPFADPNDFLILRNDWPYGLMPDITHLCVWLKPKIAVTPGDGDVTDESRKLIDDFVSRTFIARLSKVFDDAPDRVQWFKNWTSLQSVRALEHIHVLVRAVPEEILVEWTGEHAKVAM